jgi:hypothetical protein
VSHSEGNAKGRTVTLHIVSSLGGFIAKKDNWLESAGSVYEAGIGATKFHETEAEILRHFVETPTV